ncbi:MAG: AMP-dependent synthetase, partial [Bacteroidales bacterium]|nr:AMP-dependent synthetase [Bacteroidales bacterium]
KVNSPGCSKYFKALNNVTFSKNERECLVIHAPQILPESIITNDIVNLKNEKEFEFLGRYDNIINSGGVKIIPELVEQKLQKIIDQKILIGSIPDEKLGQKVILILESEKKPQTESTIRSKFLGILSKFEIPKEIIFVEKFVENEAGKINRKVTIQKAIKG